MEKFFVFNSEAEAEAFCTEGCPIYGKDLAGNEVKDKGVTTRLADWVKHPTEELWLVRSYRKLEGKPVQTLEITKEVVFPESVEEARLESIRLNK